MVLKKVFALSFLLATLSCLAQENALPLTFTELNAYQQLKELAAFPFDLTKEEALSKSRMDHFSSQAGTLKLLYGTERVTDEVMTGLENLSKETQLLEKMQAMQSGKIINKIVGYPSENRMALHTAARDLFSNPNSSEEALKAAAASKREIAKLKALMEKIDAEEKFTDMIQIGIGGSYLGPEALYVAFEAYRKPGRKVHFIANVDPDDAASIIKQADLKKTLVVVVSKSGTTLETLTNEEFVRKRYVEKGLDPKEYFIAVTGEGSPMDNPEKYLASFYIWDYIGGRYSSTSMVGAVAISFAAGMEPFMELLKGAHEMDLIALKPDLKQNLPMLGALLSAWNRNFLNFETEVSLPYSQALSRFPAHLQQLAMESNGKSVDIYGRRVNYETAPVIWGEPGTNAQHSFFQMLHQGTDIVPAEFIGFKESEFGEDIKVDGSTSQEKLLANLFAQAVALAVGEKSDNPNKVFLGNRPSRIILARKATPYTLGALLSYYEHKTAFQGFCWNINPFDQEGVQLGKKLALKNLDQFETNVGSFFKGL